MVSLGYYDDIAYKLYVKSFTLIQYIGPLKREGFFSSFPPLPSSLSLDINNGSISGYPSIQFVTAHPILYTIYQGNNILTGISIHIVEKKDVDMFNQKNYIGVKVKFDYFSTSIGATPTR